MFFIAGLTGHVGGAAARRLLAKGKQVRTLLRTPERAKEFADQGVEIQQGDLNNADALAQALQGVEGAFLFMQPAMSPPPDFSDARASLASYTAALAKAPVPRLVALSSMGSEKAEKLGNIMATSLMERAFSNLPFPRAFVRAGSFYENYASALTTAQHTGKYFSFQPVDFPFPAVGTTDIGNVVAELLLGEWTDKKVVELGSLTSAKQMAAAVSKAIGRDVEAQVMYDPDQDTWTLVGRCPTNRGDVNGAAYNGRIYVTGGEYETTKIKESIWAFESYRPSSQSWETLPHIQITRHGFAAGFIGNTLHVVGGSFQSDGMPGVYSPTATHETYSVE